MLEVGGSVMDTLSIGVRAALQATLVPKLTVTGEGEEMEIEVSDNPHDSTSINAGGAPVIITLNQASLEPLFLVIYIPNDLTIAEWAVCGGLYSRRRVV